LIVLSVSAQAVVKRIDNIPQTAKLSREYKSEAGHSIRLKYTYFGEPVIGPALIEVEIRCGGRSKKVIQEEVLVCMAETFEFDPEIGELRANYKVGYLVGGSSARCGLPDETVWNVDRRCVK
jgi:hypothetical protein